MRRGHFLSDEQRRVLTAHASDGLAEHRVARRANALILLDRGMSCQQVAKVLILDEDTVRGWRTLFERDGVDGLTGFAYRGKPTLLSAEQRADLAEWVAETAPRSTPEVSAWIANRFGVIYESRSGLAALLHRLGFDYRRPKAIARKMDVQKQRAFIASYESVLNGLADDEMVMFADAVHPTYGAQPVGCWAPRRQALAVAQTTGRQHINIQGAIDLESGETCMLNVDTVDAQSTVALLSSIEARFPKRRKIHVFLDNARCHHARLVREWLARAGCRIRLHYVPPYCPHLNPIERLWGLMHKHIRHNRCSDTFRAFQRNILTFLRYTVPASWQSFCDRVSDNFRVIDPARYRILR